MVGLAVHFELGRYHANPWGSHVNDAAIEWPPSPWRVIRALYAVTRTNTRLADRAVLIDRALEGLVAAPPPIFELPPMIAAHTRHYLPKAAYSPVNRTATDKVLDGFAAVHPEAEMRVWWDIDFDSATTDALAAAGRSLGYLGRSESVCSAHLVSGAGPASVSAAPKDSGIEVTGIEGGLIELLCPEPSASLDELAISITDMRSKKRLMPPGSRMVSYIVRLPGVGTQARIRRGAPRPTLAIFRLRGSGRPPITDAVAIGQTLRAALQSRYGRGQRGTASATFSGRIGDERRTDQHRHAHYLAVPDREGRHVDHLVVWAAEGFGPEEVSALAELRTLAIHGIDERLPLALGALGPIEEMALPELLGPSRTWRSLTPFGLVRHPKKRHGTFIDSPQDQVRRELEQRGYPQPDEVDLEAGSWHRFRSSKAGNSRLNRASVFGVRVRFSAPVSGPLALGALSHYGLGLMVPGD